MKLAQKYFFRPKYIKPKDRSETTQRTTKINKVSVSNFYQNQKNNLTMSIHEGQRNYKCDSCGKYFTISGKLKKIPFTEIFTSKQIMDYLIMIWNSNWRKNLQRFSKVEFNTFQAHYRYLPDPSQWSESSISISRKKRAKQRLYKSIEKHQQETIKSSTSKNENVLNKQLTEFLQTKIAQWCHNQPLLNFFKR